ncbi:MAG: RNA-binding protein [Bacteroidetes bacterium]|nr:RNA-binding protein [Bacteroidota bacterium]
MNIYVANLNYSIDDAGLEDLFTKFGEVSSANIITDRETGRSRGFGFVEMPNNEEGQQAIDELNDSEQEGKVITVNVARPKTDRPSRGGNGGGYNRRY